LAGSAIKDLEVGERGRPGGGKGVLGDDEEKSPANTGVFAIDWTILPEG